MQMHFYAPVMSALGSVRYGLTRCQLPSVVEDVRLRNRVHGCGYSAGALEPLRTRSTRKLYRENDGGTVNTPIVYVPPTKTGVICDDGRRSLSRTDWLG